MFPDFRKYYYLWPVALLALLIFLGYSGYYVKESQRVQRLWSNVNFVFSYSNLDGPNIPESIDQIPEIKDSIELAYFKETINFPLAKIDSLYTTVFNPAYSDSVRHLLLKLNMISARLDRADTITQMIDAQIDSLVGISNKTLSLDSLNQHIEDLSLQLDTLKAMLKEQAKLNPNPLPGLRRKL